MELYKEQIVDVLAETTAPCEEQIPHYDNENFAQWLLGKVTTEEQASEDEQAPSQHIESHSDDIETSDAFIQMINATSRD